ncbi:ABC transporter substrate-binding protein [Pseudonocardia kunmingensis]|uniref:Extracellular solute-binding protein (Family 5) n=1 Tax=Pseudonocardia kunmingensis TaxID=630975 RepID=A0A543DPT6_9PSEU|nr:ABC transporter substrate-binding protein [Pseudonocardia kunmingensis]TQM11347.1 extracellular solute-binding protein (family 5) [Pseudonocardia kunmingensis]
MKRQRRCLAGLVAIGLALAGCGGGEAGSGGAAGVAGPPDTDGALRFAWTIPAQPLDPHTPVSSVAQSPYIFPIYDRLTQLVGGPTLEPMLATEWSFSPDGQQVTFVLRDDVTFHDGTVLDADAVKVSLDRARNIDQVKVRQALNYAIDREGLDEAILDGQRTPQAQPLTSVYEGHLETPPVEYTHDPEKARRLLTEAGPPGGFEMSLLVGSGLSPQDKMAPVLQAQLGEVGVRVAIGSFDPV